MDAYVKTPFTAVQRKSNFFPTDRVTDSPAVGSVCCIVMERQLICSLLKRWHGPIKVWFWRCCGSTLMAVKLVTQSGKLILLSSVRKTKSAWKTASFFLFLFSFLFSICRLGQCPLGPFSEHLFNCIEQCHTLLLHWVLLPLDTNTGPA